MPWVVLSFLLLPFGVEPAAPATHAAGPAIHAAHGQEPADDSQESGDASDPNTDEEPESLDDTPVPETEPETLDALATLLEVRTERIRELAEREAELEALPPDDPRQAELTEQVRTLQIEVERLRRRVRSSESTGKAAMGSSLARSAATACVTTFTPF